MSLDAGKVSFSTMPLGKQPLGECLYIEEFMDADSGEGSEPY